jgi:hypothetical protein
MRAARSIIDRSNAVFRLGKRFAFDGVKDDEGQGIGMTICFAVATLHKGLTLAEERDVDVQFRLFLPKQSSFGFSDAQLLSIAKRLQIT